jgi:hypothetical protein
VSGIIRVHLYGNAVWVSEFTGMNRMGETPGRRVTASDGVSTREGSRLWDITADGEGLDVISFERALSGWSEAVLTAQGQGNPAVLLNCEHTAGVMI